MSEIFILDLKLTTQADLFLGKRTSPNNYQSHNFIPASTLKGAILTQLRDKVCSADLSLSCEKCPKNADCEFIQFRNAQMIVRPGCVVSRTECEEHQLLPNNPLTISQCKLCESLIDSTLQFVQEEESVIKCSVCEKEVPTKKISRPYCVTCQQTLDPPQKSLRTNIAINSELGTTVKGMLFFYEVIERDSLFTSQIITTNSVLKDHLLEIDNITLGRGSSRGLGFATLTIKELNSEKQLNQIQENIQKTYRDTGLIVFTAITNLCSIELSDRLYSYPYIQTISFGDNSLKLDLLRSFGNSEICSGWALNTDSQKPRIFTASPGSVFCYNPSDTIQPQQFKELANLELFGIGEPPLISNSYNQILFLRN
ncbi:MAG: RAMP superfamily CRISPR-associated protein [Candidatus Helarchaeota archaeon]